MERKDTTKLKIRDGYYLTRKGDVAEIRLTTPGTTYPFSGMIKDDNTGVRVKTWMTDGRLYNDEIERYSDLLKRISPETDPEYFI